MEYRLSTSNERVWRTTQLAKLNSTIQSVVLTANVFQLLAWYIRRVRIIWFSWIKPTTWLLILSFTQNIVRAQKKRFVHTAARGGTCAFTLKIVIKLIKTVTIGIWSPHRINPPPTRLVSGKASKCRWRLRRYQVDPWSTRRGPEVARVVICSSPQNLKK